MRHPPIARLGLAASCLLPLAATPAPAQTRADGRYPSTLSCDKLPFTAGPLRDSFAVEIAEGRATFSRKLAAGEAADAAGAVETGSGALAGGRLTLTGRMKAKAVSFESRYTGEVDGRGGLLIGVQTWSYKGQTYRRPCQLSIGNGR